VEPAWLWKLHDLFPRAVKRRSMFVGLRVGWVWNYSIVERPWWQSARAAWRWGMRARRDPAFVWSLAAIRPAVVGPVVRRGER
jgi:hypothetical protein